MEYKAELVKERINIALSDMHSQGIPDKVAAERG